MDFTRWPRQVCAVFSLRYKLCCGGIAKWTRVDSEKLVRTSGFEANIEQRERGRTRSTPGQRQRDRKRPRETGRLPSLITFLHGRTHQHQHKHTHNHHCCAVFVASLQLSSLAIISAAHTDGGSTNATVISSGRLNKPVRWWWVPRPRPKKLQLASTRQRTPRAQCHWPCRHGEETNLELPPWHFLSIALLRNHVARHCQFCCYFAGPYQTRAPASRRERPLGTGAGRYRKCW